MTVEEKIYVSWQKIRPSLDEIDDKKEKIKNYEIRIKELNELKEFSENITSVYNDDDEINNLEEKLKLIKKTINLKDLLNFEKLMQEDNLVYIYTKFKFRKSNRKISISIDNYYDTKFNGLFREYDINNLQLLIDEA
ncbi:MAG: hypothetical protein R2774_05240 [Saprospiraceae bacterium]